MGGNTQKVRLASRLKILPVVLVTAGSRLRSMILRQS
jgi:hypothetical protein